jgi:signal transduction histidine kinase
MIDRSTFSILLRGFVIANVIMVFIGTHSNGQTYQPIRHFTMENGLPSKLIYEMQQDALGNLWIATDNGISRFDGKYFKNYTFRDGLPGNDIVTLRIDRFNTLWLNCFGHKPTYFEQDAFHVIPTDTTKGISNQNYRLFNDINNEVNYRIEPTHHQTVFNKSIDGRRYLWKYIEGSREKILFNESTWLSNGRFKGSWKLIIKGKCVDSIIDKSLGDYNISYSDRNGWFRMSNRLIKEIYIKANNRLGIAEYLLDEKIIKISFSERYLFFVDKTSMVYIYNRESKKLMEKMQGPSEANSALLDIQGQLWIGTRNNGLFCYAKNNCSSYLMNSTNSHFVSIYSPQNGVVLTGNTSGEIHSLHHGVYSKLSYPGQYSINSILQQDGKIFFLGNLSVIDKNTSNKTQVKYKGYLSQIKTGLTVNDSLLFLGTISGAIFFNSHTKQLVELKSKNQVRIYACAKDIYNWIYFSQNNEIHKTRFPDAKDIKLPFGFYENEIPISLTCTKDNLLWIATNENRIYVVKNDKIIDTLQNEISQLEGFTHITNAEQQLVLSSKKGLAIIDYVCNSNVFHYKVRFISQLDGLPSNIINQAYIGKDSIYIATENGIAVLSRNFRLNKYSIYPIIQSIKIDNERQRMQPIFELKSGIHSVQAELSGVDISGHLNAMQYSLNDSLHWTSVEGNQLSLLLPPDETRLFIRYKDMQGRLGKAHLACIFIVAIPFYKRIWFFVLAISAVICSMFWLYDRQQKNKRQRILNNKLDLEQQQQNITSDLHDDIGATLSSLQLNSAIANRMIEKNPARTADILTTIETQAKELSEKVGDIIWSMKSSKEAFGTFSDRVKTYANQMLDHTTINYKIDISSEVDIYITDSHMKKNLILISKEAINNSVKYSQANLITIICKMQMQDIYLSIQDDGVGFSHDNNEGNGLKNMQQRVLECKGTLDIVSNLGNGAKIEILIPVLPKV